MSYHYTDEQTFRLLAAMELANEPTRRYSLAQSLVHWGYDMGRFDDVSDAELVESNEPDTTGFRSWVGDMADAWRVRMIDRRAAKNLKRRQRA